MTDIRTFRPNCPEAWLKAHPDQTWQCSIFPPDGSDHHGVGATEAEAILNAALHYAAKTRQTESPALDDTIRAQGRRPFGLNERPTSPPPPPPPPPPPDDTIRDGDRHYAKDFLA